jgi:FlaA1/EpsC-like NDP-sugar epimerase
LAGDFTPYGDDPSKRRALIPFLKNKRVVVTGGTGSLGKVLVRRLFQLGDDAPAQIVVLSRDEAKQHAMRIEYQRRAYATDEVIYRNFVERLSFRIGDVRDYAVVAAALRGMDVVFNAAALKQVPTCEYFPFEAVQTNVGGAENIVRVIRDLDLPVAAVIGISTDKAVKPVNVMGMTKALQERLFARANLDVSQTRFVIVRYGNVLASRGSVIPLFHDQIRHGGPVTITNPLMTRFLLSLDEAVDLIFAALGEARRGETYIPHAPAARIVDIAKVLIGDRPIETVVTGTRPGEKLHEILISEEEAHRAMRRGGHYVVAPILPELQEATPRTPTLTKEYSSEDNLLNGHEIASLLAKRRLLVGDAIDFEGEILR